MSGFTLSDLEKIVDERSKASPEESWTAKLFAAGQPKAAKKLGVTITTSQAYSGGDQDFSAQLTTIGVFRDLMIQPPGAGCLSGALRDWMSCREVTLQPHGRWVKP